ncbi:MAG: DUF3095 domain-containing protein [Anaerolineaceae bacterium]|nr:MAG: DUF3095 domain-containing protein [Anaerolineaceae bacterium]
MSPTNNFYTSIKPMSNISQLTDPRFYHDVPDDWYIALSDVRGSTRAIEAGRYKEVCAVAAAGIAAQLNLFEMRDTPFVFGGDGASVLIPPEYYEQSRAALAGTRRMAREQFDLDLRVGIVPMRDVLDAGHLIRVARLEMSPNFQQAIFTGGGLRHAEDLLKDADAGPRYDVPEDVAPQADFYGVECRWKQIPSRKQEVVTLMVMATAAPSAHNDIYREVLERIEAIYGDTKDRHPIALSDVKMTFSPATLSIEGRIRHEERYSARVLARMMYGSLKAMVAMIFNIGGWGGYKEIMHAATDHEKFDDTLRMVFSGTADQRRRLTAHLDSLHAEGRIVYGVHIGQHTLITCIMYDYFGHQMHLVDGANGGYTLAAKGMKKQMAALQNDAD